VCLRENRLLGYDTMAPEALSLKSVAVLGGLLASCSPAAMNARDIPPNLQQFYDTVKVRFFFSRASLSDTAV